MAFDPLYDQSRAMEILRREIEEKYRKERDYYQKQMYYQMKPAFYSAPISFQPQAALEPPKNSPDFLDKVEKLKTAEARTVCRPVADYVEPVVGWRCWKTDGQKLIALGQQTIWEPKKAMEAKCVGVGGHQAPHKTCECGIWAFNTIGDLLGRITSYSQKPIIGTVSMWGRIIQCSDGWRAQYAYPKELWLLDSSHEQLGYIYGVPVRTA